MKLKRLLTALIILLSGQTIGAQNTHQLDSTVLTSRIVKDSIDIPWEIIWGPDDYIWCTERFGRVSRINPSTGQQDILLDISSDVYEKSEAGMLGMVLHPDFTNTPAVFIAYTYLSGSDIRERLVRFNYTGNNLVATDTLIENIIGNTTHIGSRLIILADNTLLMSTGDAQNQSLPQNKGSIVGKILRINLDGSVPADNPDPTSLVWSYGHRNAQGMWLAPNGIIYSSEHGPTTDDELNILVANENYGWPNVAGFCDTPPEVSFCTSNGVKEPLVAYTPTIAPSDIIWYDHPSIPEFQNKLLMTVLKDKKLIVYTFNTAGDMVIDENDYLVNAFGRLRDVCVSPSGNVYLATNGSSWTNTSPFTHSIIELRNNQFVSISNDGENHGFGLRVFPNPISQGQTLSIEGMQLQKYTFELYNQSGQLVLQKTVSNKDKIEMNTTSGMHFYKLTDDTGLQVFEKLLIK